MSAVSLRLVVLASGDGTNLQAILDRMHGRDGIEVVGVAGDRPEARALQRAAAAGIEVAAFARDGFADRAARDTALADQVDAWNADLVVLAGYMALLDPSFTRRFAERIINVHPSLLPAFPGLRAIEQALDAGVAQTGVTVHVVDEGMDTGRVLEQAAVAIESGDTPQSLHERLRPVEHDLLCAVIRSFARERGRLHSMHAADPASVPNELPDLVQVKRALLSVSDKRGIVDFARGLIELGVELVSTGGTAAELTAAGLEVRTIEDFTGFPEMMDGRVKTLHPRLYAGLLAVRDNPEHAAAAHEHGIEMVDLVCVNLYPFERTSARIGVSDGEVIENIDIGGPTMIRAAAKNHAYAAVVVKPESYDAVIEELRENEGALSFTTRQELAAQAFHDTARYDTAIARWFAERSDDFPPLLVRAFEKVTDLSYGENPHQRAAYYQGVGSRTHLLSMVKQHHGKQLSFNNLLDLDSARALARDFDEPACAIVKHNNPCGAATGTTALAAYTGALACDPLSAFGGVIAINRPVDEELAQALAAQFIEVLIAPAYSDEALALLTVKQNVRILEDQEKRQVPLGETQVRQVQGGILVQDRDTLRLGRDGMAVVTQRQPSDQEWSDMLFAWRVCKHVKSNAIVLASGDSTVGIGAGQMSRVDSVRIAVEKCRLDSLEGAVMASDAFFPFADGPALAIEAGVRAIIQPGGSVRDDEVIAAADEAGVAMVMTRRRHFRH